MPFYTREVIMHVTDLFHLIFMEMVFYFDV